MAVALGGAIGSVGRYTIALTVEKVTRANFPLGTLTANLLGCLLIGLFWGYFERAPLSNEFRLFLFTGVLGGFTTFSTFARENIQYLRVGEPLNAIIYLCVSNILGLTLVAAGFLLSFRLLRSVRLF